MPAAPVRVALVQLEVTDAESVDDRLTRVVDLAREAAAGADLVLLPEMWHVGAFAVDLAEKHAQGLGDEVVTALREVAESTATWVHGGSFSEVTPDGRHFNTSVLVSPYGEIAETYRKVHLFGFDGGETTLMSSGERLVVTDSPLGPTGLATCYDLRFPEMFRGLTELGAESFLVPAGWPERRIAHWTLLARARAVENQAFVLACNGAGTHAGVPIGGRSLVVDPHGEVLAEAGTGEEVLVAEIDPDRVQAWRDAFPVLPDRRL
ncbi:MAG: carbon-nitrogen family hydrolase [Candidatus Nanopelagicales bacterium]